jgi:predicted secreted acid phosphatase
VHVRKIWVVLVVVGLLAAVGAVALASPSLPIVAPTPKLADQMTNIDVLRQEIKNYYGVPNATTGSGATAGWTLPLNPDSNYANEAEKVAADGSHWLAAKAHAKSTSTKKAIVLDVDDTTLATFNYELYSNWDYNPTTNANFVNGELFPAVPGMVDMVNQAEHDGYAIIYLTGRPDSQHAVTIGNLQKVDYSGPTALSDGSDGLFTKPPLFLDPPTNSILNPAYPQYLKDKCGTTTTCNTDEYKSATREYIEKTLGYDIVANFGDQYSDMSGGFEDRTFKLPNPSYFLP